MLDPKRVQATRAVAISHFRVAAVPVVFTSSVASLCVLPRPSLGCPLLLLLLLLLLLVLLLAPMGVVERIVDLCAYPQAVQEHRELPGHGHRRPLLCVLAAPGGYLLPMASQVRIGAEGTQDVVGAAYQELPQHLVALLGDAFLGVPLSGAVGCGNEPQVRPYRATLLEAVGVLQGEHEGERRERPDTLDLAQELRFWVMLFADRF